MSKNLTISYSKAKYISLIFIAILMSWIVVNCTSDCLSFAMIGIAWCSIITMYVFAQTKLFHMSENGKLIVMAGFFARIGLAWLGTYGTDTLAAWLRAGDQEYFLEVALRYFSDDFSVYSTRYPYVLYIIFQIMGPNRIMLQVINILCWFLGIKILLLVIGGLYGRKSILLLLFYTFLPYPLLISTQVMRESMINLFSMLCFLYILKWIDSGHIKYMVIMLAMSLFPIALHAGNIALVIGAFFIYMQWDCNTCKWRKFHWFCIVLILCIVVVIPIYENVFARYFDYLPQSISLKAITSKYFVSGRSDYVSPVVINNLGQFIFWSIYRMLYFWISPTPRFWSSPADIVGFLFDSIPMILLFWQIFKNIKKKKRYSKSLAGLYILIAYTIIYAWGTVNAGTAMRHRGQLLGIMTMAVLFDMNNGQAERSRRGDKDAVFNYSACI